jgi:hypothetical protein
MIRDIEAIRPLPLPSNYFVNEQVSAAVRLAELNREPIVIGYDELTNDVFKSLWSNGRTYPIVVPNVGKKLQYPWNPEFFMRILGTADCQIQNCRTGKIVDSTVGDFFKLFGKLDGDEVWRLKVIYNPLVGWSVLELTPYICFRTGRQLQNSRQQSLSRISVQI